MESNNFYIASRGQRIINLIIDTIAYLVIWFILSTLIMLLGFDQIYSSETGEELPLTPLFILFPSFWGYYIITEFVFQKTIGKIFTDTKVISTNGDKPTINQIIIRTLCRNIPFEYISFLAVSEGIHDRLSRTRVIRS